jgi:hypothetical protein
MQERLSAARMRPSRRGDGTRHRGGGKNPGKKDQPAGHKRCMCIESVFHIVVLSTGPGEHGGKLIITEPG